MSKDPSGRFYASLLVDKKNIPVKKPKEEIRSERVVGLDMSVPDLFVDSTGKNAQYPKYFRKNESKLAWEQRKLSRKVKDSGKYKKQKIKVARIYAFIADSRKDFLDKLSSQITNDYDLICSGNP